MKYQVGEKVKYDSGDWWFYGTVTAVIDNSIFPCYRINVDSMVKKNCKFSITQFEFELKRDNGEVIKSDSEPESKPMKKPGRKPGRKPENKNKKQIENPLYPDSGTPKPEKRIRGEAWDRNFDNYRNGEKSNTVYTWVAHNRKLYQSGALKDDKLKKLLEINFPFEVKKKSPKKR